MNIEDYLEQKKILHDKLLLFINKEDFIEECFQNLINIIRDQKILENSYEFKVFLRLILNMSNHHNRFTNFFNKIEEILKFLKENIKQTFSNTETFNIFKNNKRILLFAFKEDIIVPDQFIIKTIKSKKYSKMNYSEYFSKEIGTFFDHEIQKVGNNNFEQNRIIGENDTYLCQLIRNDFIDKFISYVNQNNILLSTTVESSIYETNLFLLKNNPSLIEYAAFFGSTQIFKYLYLNGVALTSSLWIFAIHGNNPELFSYVEELKLKPDDLSYKKCLIESIKCHHIDMANYILNNYVENYSEDDFNVISQILKYHNFCFIPTKIVDFDCFFYFLCQYDYFTLVNIFLKVKKLNINAMVI